MNYRDAYAQDGTFLCASYFRGTVWLDNTTTPPR